MSTLAFLQVTGDNGWSTERPHEFTRCSALHVRDQWSLESQREGRGTTKTIVLMRIVPTRTVNVPDQKMETARVTARVFLHLLHALGSLEAGLLDPRRVHL